MGDDLLSDQDGFHKTFARPFKEGKSTLICALLSTTFAKTAKEGISHLAYALLCAPLCFLDYTHDTFLKPIKEGESCLAWALTYPL